VTYEPQRPSGGEPDDTPPDGIRAVGQESQTGAERSHTRRNAAIAIVALLALGGLIGGVLATSRGSGSQPSAGSRPRHRPPATHGFALGPPTTTAHLLEHFEYVGPSDSGGFAVPSSSVASYYMYKCPGRRPSAFYAEMLNADGSDRQTIAKTAGHIGTGSVVLHPKYPGSAYHLAIRTNCVYRIRVYDK
jgi:hypothetical protein